MEFKLERTDIEVLPLNSKTSDRAYWMSKTPEERFEALEYLRQPRPPPVTETDSLLEWESHPYTSKS